MAFSSAPHPDRVGPPAGPVGLMRDLAQGTWVGHLDGHGQGFGGLPGLAAVLAVLAWADSGWANSRPRVAVTAVVIASTFSGRHCGTFVSGKRSWCEDQVVSRGAGVADTITPYVNYLVIGRKVSHGWVNQSYGRKIEHALDFRNNGGKIALVHEDHWLAHLKVN